MLIIPPAPFRKRRRRLKVTAPAKPVVLITSVLQGDHQADWCMDTDVAEVLDISPLRINGAQPTGLVLVAGGVV
jgi:hypothetical protein